MSERTREIARNRQIGTLWILLAGILSLSVGVASAAPDDASADVTVMTPARSDSTGFVHPATPGVVTGHVTSSYDGQGLDYTNIVFHIRDERGRWVPAGGTIALRNGYFVHRCSPGIYRIQFLYIGHDRKVLEDVVVHPAETVELDVEMKLRPIDMPMHALTASRIDNTEFALRSQQQKAVAVQDAISAEEISRGTDGTAAEALERVTGLTVVGGKFVFVRGLGDRYSQTQLNGATLSSPEPNKRTVPLDVFPSALLENVVVQKTYTPDMEGEFGGGVVNVSTRDYVDRRSFSQSFGFGYGLTVLRSGVYDYAGGDYDRLAYDDGTRAIPGAIPDQRLNQSGRTSPGFTIDELKEFRKAFPNVWEPRGGGSQPNFSYSGNFSDGFHLFGRQLGVVAALTLKNNFTTLEGKTEREYRSNTDEPLRDYSVDESTFSSLGGGTMALSYRLSDDDVIKLNSLYTRSADDRARLSEGPNTNFGTDVRQYTLTYNERVLGSQVLSGRHGALFGSTVNWVGSYSDANFSEPDNRAAVYESLSEGQPFTLSGRVQNPFLRTYGESQEFDRSAQLSWAMPLPSRWMKDGEVKVGAFYRNRDRSSGYRRFGIRCKTRDCAGIDYTLPPELLLDPLNPDTQSFYVVEDTRAADSWAAGQDVSAAFSMLDLRFGRLRTVGGLRVERSDTRVVAKSPYAVDDAGVDVSRRFEDGLPAVHLTYALTERQNLRASYSKTLNRPELREVSPFAMYNYDENVEESGNPNLVQARLHSYDLRWEFFPGFTRYMAVSGFYKDLRHPIEQKLEARPGSVGRVPVNGDTGILRGMEFETRVMLSDVAKALTFGALRPSGFAEQVGFAANHTRIFSEVHVPTATDVQPDTPRRTVSLTGQSDRATNLSLIYQGERADASITYKMFGRRLFAVGVGTLPEIYEYPASSLDAAYSWQLRRDMSVKVTGENLTGSVVERLQGDAVWQRWAPGQSFGISLSFSR